MKATSKVVVMLLVSALSWARVSASDVSATVADHEAKAAQYLEKVKAQDALIAEHTQMKKYFRRRYYVNEKLTPMKTAIEPMEKHCDAIIKDATKLKGELEEFAKWHDMRAAELKGQ
jgi:uncharacterized coiled-coil DUF342 family protein